LFVWVVGRLDERRGFEKWQPGDFVLGLIRRMGGRLKRRVEGFGVEAGGLLSPIDLLVTGESGRLRVRAADEWYSSHGDSPQLEWGSLQRAIF
jgi:hypothetical protein